MNVTLEQSQFTPREVDSVTCKYANKTSIGLYGLIYD